MNGFNFVQIIIIISMFFFYRICLFNFKVSINNVFALTKENIALDFSFHSD